MKPELLQKRCDAKLLLFVQTAVLIASSADSPQTGTYADTEEGYEEGSDRPAPIVVSVTGDKSKDPLSPVGNGSSESGREDSNLRPLDPQPYSDPTLNHCSRNGYANSSCFT